MTPAGRDLPPEGRLDGATHLFPVRVYYEDTDRSGVVYHANYLRWMERARTEMLRCAGIDHGAHVATQGAGYALSGVTLRYRAPARLDEALLVATRLVAARRASVVIQQTVRRGEAVLVEAEIVAALVGDDGRPRRQPSAWLAIYDGLLARDREGPSARHQEGQPAPGET